MTIRFLNPVQEADMIPAKMARRLKSLDDMTLGFLSNGKTNAAKLLDMIAARLKSAHRIKAVISATKGSAVTNCPPELIENLVDQCDAIITGIGD